MIKGTEVLASISLKPDVLSEVRDCQWCGMKKFYSETSKFCCSDGKVILQENKLPDILVKLFIVDNQEGHTSQCM